MTCGRQVARDYAYGTEARVADNVCLVSRDDAFAVDFPQFFCDVVLVVCRSGVLQFLLEGAAPVADSTVGNMRLCQEVWFVVLGYAVYFVLQLFLALHDGETVLCNEGGVIPDAPFVIVEGAYALARHE